MDKNSIIGLLLIGAIMIVWSIMTSPSEAELEQQRLQDSVAQTERLAEERRAQEAESPQSQAPAPEALDDSTRASQYETLYGAFAQAAQGQNQFVSIENELIRLTVSTQGGKPYNVTLKEERYTRYDSVPVHLFDGPDNFFGFSFFAQNRLINTNDLFFEPQAGKTQIEISPDGQAQTLKLRLDAGGSDRYIEYAYTLTPGSYVVDFDVRYVGMNQVIASNVNMLDFKWQFDAPRQEKGKSWETDNTTIFYQYYDDEVNYLTERSEMEEEDITTDVKWFAFKQQFFSTILIAETAMNSALLKYQQHPDPDYIANFLAETSFPYAGGPEQSIALDLYFGPNRYAELKEVGKTYEDVEVSLQEIIPLGWGIFGWVNRFLVIPLFNLLGGFISNYGLLILVMTLLIKLLLFPLTFKSYQSSAKMKALKPDIDELSKKYPADKPEKQMEKQQAVMALYRKAGVNPLGGCLPILLQMPILIAMFRFFPASIELRHQSFLWAEDLSTYDSILDLPFSIPFYGDHVSLFTLLMAAAIVVSTQLNSGQMNDANSQVPGMKFMMLWLMPIMMVFWFNSYSSGLSYYYFISNIVTIAQVAGFRRFTDDEAIRRKLHEAKRQPEKKSRLQTRMEELQKEQARLRAQGGKPAPTKKGPKKPPQTP